MNFGTLFFVVNTLPIQITNIQYKKILMKKNKNKPVNLNLRNNN